MKSLYRSAKYKLHQERVARRALKRRIKRRARIRVENKRKFKRSKVELKEMDIRSVEVYAPENFCFLTNPDKVSNCLKSIEVAFKKNKRVFVHMDKVREIDYVATSALLAVMFRFKERRIKFNGSFPADPTTEKMFRNSGFIYTLFDNSGLQSKHLYKIGEDNQMITQIAEKRENQKDVSKLTTDIMKDVSNTIWGNQRNCKGVHIVLAELIANTIEHAPGDTGSKERWWLSINHDKENKKVGFVFVDYGVGIFRALASKPNDHPLKQVFKKVNLTIGTSSTGDLLKTMVTTSARETSSIRRGRGNGIHSIYKSMQRNEIDGLHIISNTGYGSVCNKEYNTIKSDFNGTLFYWELCYTSKNSKWII